MIRKIITIDREKCNGCGRCASACHEGAIAMIDGKAKLIRDDYCDGLGNCLPVCPVGAISFEKRDAEAYDEEGVKAAQAEAVPAGCPGMRAKTISRREPEPLKDAPADSMLKQWPVQIKLMPAAAPYYKGAALLIAADCTAFACGSFHRDYMNNKITMIGCPKLDEGDYAEKLTQILTNNRIKSVTVVRMEVPCCGGLTDAVIRALRQCGKMIPWRIITLATDGQVLEQ